MLRGIFIFADQTSPSAKAISENFHPDSATGEAYMNCARLAHIAGLLVMVLLGGGAAVAQTAPAQSPMKTIGTPSAAAKSEVVPSLIVLNSRGATLQGDILTLTGVTPNSILFADRPVRAAGHILTAHLIADWGASTPGNDSFVSDPPNECRVCSELSDRNVLRRERNPL
jgi:hypothetical protein